MEIDDLKVLWKKESERFTPKDKAELESMLKRRSTSIVSRLKRSVWFELIFTIAGGVALLLYAITLPAGPLGAISVSVVVLFCVYSLYYFKKLQLLNEFDPANDNLLATLNRLIDSMKSYLKLYKRSYAVLYPFYFFLGLFFTALDYGTEAFISRISRPEIIVALILFAAAFFACSTWLTGWYLKKLYGNHLEKLESLLNELRTTHDS